MVITDAISFNILCRGQLEFLCSNYDVELTLVAGGSESQHAALIGRNLGRVVRVPFRRKPSLLWDLTCLVRLILFFFFNRFDVVIYSTPKAMLLASIASFICGQKRRHSIIRGRAYEGYSGFKRKLFLFFDLIVFRLSHSNVAISRSLKQSYIDDGFEPEDMVVLGAGSSNGVDLSRFSPEIPEKQGPYVFRVGAIGRICKDKGVEEVSKVVRSVKAENPDVEFLIVGQVEDAIGQQELSGLLADGFVEYVPHMEDIHRVFAKLDVHLFLTHREGFGNVALEAAACSVPTYAFDVVGVKDSVNAGVTGEIFRFGDSSGVANEILMASEGKASFRQRYKGARQWAVSNFDQSSVWRRYFDFFLD